MTGIEGECGRALPILVAGALRLELDLDSQQGDQFIRYCSLLLEANQSFNLTAIRSPDEVMRVLFLDSLVLAAAVYPHLPDSGSNLTVADVGSGAGIPGIPLAIAHPSWRLTLMESIGKKAAFLRQAAGVLRLERVAVQQERAEVLGRQAGMRDSFGLVVARAVAPLASLLELCAPLARTGALLALPKSGPHREEIRAAEFAAMALGSSLLEVVPVPDELGLGSGRVTVLYRKERPTPRAYPRGVGVPRSRPLGSGSSQRGTETPRSRRAPER